MMATKKAHYRDSQQKAQVMAFTSTVALAFIVGAMMGASMALGVVG